MCIDRTHTHTRTHTTPNWNNLRRQQGPVNGFASQSPLIIEPATRPQRQSERTGDCLNFCVIETRVVVFFFSLLRLSCPRLRASLALWSSSSSLRCSRDSVRSVRAASIFSLFYRTHFA